MPNDRIRYFQKGFNFSQDGPGNRLVYHLYGCNFRCPWCSNPECFTADTKVTEQSIDEILAEIQRSRAMFFSGGGVTFTGGEPTVQFDALKVLLIKLKENGIHTAMECNASHPKLGELFPYIDFLMMDLKHPFDLPHKEIMGVGVEIVKQNISHAASSRQLALRIPLINGYNTDEACIDGMIEFLTSLPATKDFTVELIAYHEYGKVKWQQHGMEYRVKDGFVSPTRMAEIKARFLKNGIKTVQT